MKNGEDDDRDILVGHIERGQIPEPQQALNCLLCLFCAWPCAIAACVRDSVDPNLDPSIVVYRRNAAAECRKWSVVFGIIAIIALVILVTTGSLNF